MKNKEKDGGPAFPTMTDGGYAIGGITVRDYFAGQALQGHLARTNNVEAISTDLAMAEENGMEVHHFVAHMMYQIADAMLEARKK